MVETALQNFALGDGAALDIADISQLFTQTFEHGDGFRGRTAVVAPLHDAVVGVRTHHYDV